MSSDYGLRQQPFPVTAESGFNASFGPQQDLSYPSRYDVAREIFLRPDPSAPPPVKYWHSFVDGSGRGLAHSQSPVCNGRKFWVWGTDIYDLNRVAALSSSWQRQKKKKKMNL